MYIIKEKVRNGIHNLYHGPFNSLVEVDKYRKEIFSENSVNHVLNLWDLRCTGQNINVNTNEGK